MLSLLLLLLLLLLLMIKDDVLRHGRTEDARSDIEDGWGRIGGGDEGAVWKRQLLCVGQQRVPHLGGIADEVAERGGHEGALEEVGVQMVRQRAVRGGGSGPGGGQEGLEDEGVAGDLRRGGRSEVGEAVGEVGVGGEGVARGLEAEGVVVDDGGGGDGEGDVAAAGHDGGGGGRGGAEQGDVGDEVGADEAEEGHRGEGGAGGGEEGVVVAEGRGEELGVGVEGRV